MPNKISIHLRDLPKFDSQEIHEKGADAYVLGWLTANQAVVNAASQFMDVSQPAARQMLPFLILRLLQSFERAGYLNESAMGISDPQDAANTLRQFNFN